MNCKEFETLVNDIAGKRMLDASLREETHSHAKDCARCSARLAEEKQLTVGLRALAILDENQKASASVEANLLLAFRSNAKVARKPVSSTSFASFAWSRQSRSNRWWVAAATVILVMLALVALRFQNASKDVKAPEQQVKQQELLPNNKENPAVLPVVRFDNNEKKAPLRKASKKESDKLKSQLASSESTGDAATMQEPIAQDEIATPYLSLTQGYTLPMSEGGQIVRVELPRSALASFGLPVNADRINERVKADVVIGNDGIARAIRFVR